MHVILLNMIKGNLFLYAHRFDKLLYLGVSEDNESQMRILAALTRKYVNIMSRLMGKPTICIGENKDADQLRGNREADQRLCFRYLDSTIPLLL